MVMNTRMRMMKMILQKINTKLLKAQASQEDIKSRMVLGHFRHFRQMIVVPFRVLRENEHKLTKLMTE
jgi:hypothetical protein